MQFYPMRWQEPIPYLVPVVTEMPWREPVVLLMPFKEQPSEGFVDDLTLEAEKFRHAEIEGCRDMLRARGVTLKDYEDMSSEEMAELQSARKKIFDDRDAPAGDWLDYLECSDERYEN
jgi:hypothetical protein